MNPGDIAKRSFKCACRQNTSFCSHWRTDLCSTVLRYRNPLFCGQETHRRAAIPGRIARGAGVSPFAGKR